VNFQPKTKDELDSMGLLKAGTYPFSIINAKDKTSKNGNDMIELTIEAYDSEGKSSHIFDYLLEAMPQKLFAFCSATGMEHHYHRGSLTSNDCIGKTAYVEIEIQKGKENPQGGTYPDKNNVKKYTTKPVNSSTPEVYQTSSSNNEFDDDIPF
jgi:hypothetical protein